MDIDMATTTKRRTAPKRTPIQIRRKTALLNAGVSYAEIARELTEREPERPVTRQAVSNEVLDADPYGSERIRRAIVRALNRRGHKATLWQYFPEHHKRGEK